MGVRNWRRESRDREQWRAVLEEAVVHRELYCQKEEEEKKKKKEEEEEKKKKKKYVQLDHSLYIGLPSSVRYKSRREETDCIDLHRSQRVSSLHTK